MRILYFSRDYTPHDHRFLAALAKTEHKIYYLRLERCGRQLEDRPLPPEIEQITWRGGRGPASLLAGPGLLADLKRVIDRIKPDLIQAGPLQRSAFLAALAGFHPLLSMSWGYDLIHDVDRNVFWRWATRYTLKHSDVMVGDCDTIRQLAISHGMPGERIVTFPWGIDLAHFHPGAARPKDTDTFILLSTRSWEPIYGVDLVAEAFVQVAQKHPEARLVMLGNGSQAKMLREIFLRGQVSERVTFPGHINRSDLPRYYRSADLYLAATHSDGTSISMLEAMACGAPVLVSDIPGNQEWVTPGEQGWMFPDGDVNALTQAIINAIKKRERLPAMGQAARKLAEVRADWQINFQELLRAYQMAMRSSG